MAVWLGSGIFQLKCLQYDWARKFSDYKNCSAKKISFDLLISNSHGPSMYTLFMDNTHSGYKKGRISGQPEIQYCPALLHHLVFTNQLK